MCINQEDIKERNHQVIQMGRIYHSAQRVVAWLGPIEDPAAIGAIKGQAKLPSKDARRVADFLSTQDYWGRLWIIQELLEAQDIFVKFGKEDIPWNDLCYFFEQQYLQRNEIRKTIAARLCHEWQDRQVDKSQNRRLGDHLFDLCSRYAEAKCEDPRDKIFGLLGIAAECCREAVPVNYSLSKYEIYGLVIQHHCLDHIYD